MRRQGTNNIGRIAPALAAIAVLLMASSLAQAQSWTKLTNTITGFAGAGTALLLTDGTVLVHQSCTPNWYKLTPDNTGSYIKGTWSAATSMQATHGPLYFGSVVLADGRLVAVGGEYNLSSCASNTAVETNLADIYNPKTNAWSALPAPPFAQVGDSQMNVLPNGQALLFHLLSKSIARLDPATLLWSSATSTGKADNNSEEGAVLLPNGTILVVDAGTQGGTGSEIYNPATGLWTSAGSTVVSLPNRDGFSGIVPELGPGMLLPNGTVYWAGSTTHNSIYNISAGTWSAAPDFPSGLAFDAPAALLPGGNVLVVTSGAFAAPSKFFEFTGSAFTSVPDRPGASGSPSFGYRFLLLPTGQVLTMDGSSDIYIYTPASTAPGSSAWRPTITSFPLTITPGGTNISLSGTQFNGLSQGTDYGDDAQAASNYPIVRITNTGTGHVFYRNMTHDHSTMAVATGSATVSTTFDAFTGLEPGASSLVVIANGIPSLPASITVLSTGTTLAFTAGSATTADYNDPATVAAKLTDTTTGIPISGKSITFVLGAGTGTETCSGTTDATGVASCSITPNEAPGSYTLKATFGGDATYPTSNKSTTFTITKEESALVLAGPNTSDFHDAVAVKATLTTDGNPLQGKTVKFTLNGAETCSAVTNALGVASCSITPNEAAGTYTLTASFGPDTFYVSSSDSGNFVVTKEETTLNFTASSPTVVANGFPATFSAILKEDGVTPIASRTVSITLGGTQTCSGVTAATGIASCTIPTVSQPLGPNTVTANFAGDAFYKPSSDTEAVILFEFLSNGSMVVGNLNAAVGSDVKFWGAQWANNNSLSGGSSPDSFKGFADSAPHACGGTWDTAPGNSSQPPAVVPSYMGVIASSSAGKAGNSISGNVPMIVVIKTNPGYGPDPGQAGTGRVVATFCQ